MRPTVVRWIRSPSAARLSLAVIASLGVIWWLAVLSASEVRDLTLGGWSPRWLAGPDVCLFVAASAIAAVGGSWRWAAAAAGWTTAVSIALVVYALSTGEAGWGAVAMVPSAVLTVAAAVTLRAGTFPTKWFFSGPFRFRVAGPRTSGGYVTSSLGQLVVFWGTFFVLVPAALAFAEDRMGIGAASLDRRPVHTAGWLLLGVGSAVGLWACITMAVRGQGTPLPSPDWR